MKLKNRILNFAASLVVLTIFASVIILADGPLRDFVNTDTGFIVLMICFLAAFCTGITTIVLFFNLFRPHYEISQNSYSIRRRISTLVGGIFHVYAADRSLKYYVEMKPLRLKEDIRVYSDRSKKDELLRINGTQRNSKSIGYDTFYITDSSTHQKLGGFQIKVLKSIIRDEIAIFDSQENDIGVIKEEGNFLRWLLRRLHVIPIQYEGFIGENQVFVIRQNFNLFALTMTLDFSDKKTRLIDERVGIIAAIVCSWWIKR